MLKPFALALLFLVTAPSAVAEIDRSMPEASSGWQAITVEDIKINVSTPSGFVTTSEKIPELATVFKQYFPPNTALYEIFATQENIDGILDGSQQELEKYLLITQPVEMQKKSFGKNDLVGIAEALKKDGDNLFDNQVQKKIDSSVKKGNASLSKMIDEKVDLQLTKLGFLGVSEVTENFVIFSLRADVSTDKGGEKVTVIASSAFLLVGNKIIMLAAYASEYDLQSRESGLSWTQSEVSKWAKEISLANTDSVKGN